jgi:TRAP-type C4-dicarboxylate transport system permease small subunit
VKAARTIVSGLANGLAVAGLSLLLILAVFTLLDGLLRAVVNTPIDLVREIGDMVAAICGTCCLPIVLLHRNNIVLRIFDRILPPSDVRVIDTIAPLVIEIVMIGMAWQFWLFGIKTMRAGDVTWLLNWPKAPFWFAVDGILWVAVAVQTFVLIEEITGARRHHDPGPVA